MAMFYTSGGTTYYTDETQYSRLMLNAASMHAPYYAVGGLFPQQHGNHFAISSDTFRYNSADMHESGDSSEEGHAADGECSAGSTEGPTIVDYIGYALPMDNFSSTMQMNNGMPYKYVDPDSFRDFFTLHAMLPFIQPARLRNSFFGPTLDLVEEHTGHKFAIAVPKKMLVLFCGRKVISRFLRTLEREDNEKWQGGPVTQELCFPPNYTNHIGMKIIISWMDRACHKSPEETKPIRVPKNLFAALSLSRALSVFGLHRDANRVDKIIAAHHYKRPLYLNEMISIWNCLPKDSKYTYRMVEDLRKQRSKYENGDKKSLPDAEEVLEFLEQNPELKARVDDPEYNIEPFFGTEWCARAALRTQQMLAAMDGLQDDSTLVDTNSDSQTATRNAKDYGRRTVQPRQGNSQHSRRREPQEDWPKAEKQTITLSEWQPQAAPTAWPEFEKTVVLQILDTQEAADGNKDTHIRADSAHGVENAARQW